VTIAFPQGLFGHLQNVPALHRGQENKNIPILVSLFW